MLDGVLSHNRFDTANEIDRQLWEIDENLIRSELTATQQAEHLAKRKELWHARKLGWNNLFHQETAA